MPGHEPDGRPRIVIVGGGFGGAYCAQALERRHVQRVADVVLLDRNNYFIFYPLLVEAGTGGLEPRHAVVSMRAFLASTEFRLAEVTGVDPDARLVHYRQPGLDRRATLRYDRLVLSLGCVSRSPEIPGLREHALSVKSMSDAVALRDRAIHMLELADATDDPDLRRALLSFVVIGGSFTGVEVAGEYWSLLTGALRRYRRLSRGDVSVTLVEMADRILPALDRDLSEYAARAMRRCGLTILLNEAITRVAADAVELRSGRCIPAQTVIWCAGIAPSPLIARLPFPTDSRGYLLTERDLRIPGQEHIWAIGDCAVNVGPDGQAYPATAQHAVRQAAHAAADILRTLHGQPTRPCDIVSSGSIAAVGCRTGVAKVFGIKIAGFLAWWLYRSVYLLKMPGWSRRVRIALDWTLDLLFPRDYVQLSVHRRELPGAPAEAPNAAHVERRSAELVARH